MALIRFKFNLHPKSLDKCRQKGMTLLEVLVAMTLMVIISAIAYASLNGLIDAKTHTDKVAYKMRQELIFSQQLSKDIHAIIDRKSRDAFGAINPSLIGSYSNVQFNRNGHVNPLNQKRSELQKVQWYFQDQQVFRRSLNQLDVGNFPQWRIRKYLDNVSEVNINYINTIGKESRQWPRTDNPNVKLRLIQFHVVYEDGTTLKYALRPGL